MSSPIRHAKDLDAALMYAPPWARDPERAAPLRPAAAAVERPRWSWLAESAGGGSSGDRAMVELQRQLALIPDGIPEPPQESTQAQWPFVLRLCAVGGVAALVAWGVVTLPVTKKAATEAARADTPPPPPLASNRVKVVQVRSAALVPPLVQDRFAAQDEQPPPPPRVDDPPAPTAQPAAPQSVGAALALDGDEIATLLKRGKDFAVNGDLSSARLLLRRAAEAGSAEAALALGATFDPLVIARLGAIGAEPDVARARQWYQKAAELGSSDASQQLAKLAQSHQ
jgi:hypothetical protein